MMQEPAGCLSKELLVTHLYGECEPEEARQVEAHLAGCAACASEFSALGGVRTDLAGWAPPEEVLGFRVVSDRAPVAPAASRWWWPMPVWAQAMAAVLVVAAGVSVANVEVRYGTGGVVVTTGWMRPAAQAPGGEASSPAPVVRPGSGAGQEAWRTELAALETRLRDEMRAHAPAEGAPSVVAASAAPPPAPALTEDQVVARVRQLLDQSEERQRRDFAIRLAQAVREMDSQRRADLVRVQEGFGQLEGRTGLEVARTNEMLRYLMRASQTQVIR